MLRVSTLLYLLSLLPSTSSDLSHLQASACEADILSLGLLCNKSELKIIQTKGPMFLEIYL